MAKLAPVVESLDKVPDAHREFYTEDKENSRWVLDTDIESHPAIGGLKTALKTERSNAGAKAEEARKLAEKIAELEKKIGEGDGTPKDHKDLDKLLTKREAEVRAEYAPKVKRLEELETGIMKRDRSDAMRKASAGSGIMSDRYDDAMQSADRYLDYQDGKLIVLDADGDPSSMSPEKFFKEKFKELKPYFYEGPKGSGSGTPPGGGGSGGGGEDLSGLSPVERINRARAKAAAGK